MIKEKKYHGIIVPLITPLKNHETLDHTGLEQLVAHILSGDVSGLFVLGTTGEGPFLSYDLRHEVVERVCKQVSGRVPVLVGISDTVLSESIRLAETSAKYGAEAVVSTPPYYSPLAQDDLVSCFNRLADALPLPLFLYNMPSHTKVMITPGTVRTLSENKNIIGLKDSSADMRYFLNLVSALKDHPDFMFFVGPEEMLMHSILSGSDGGVNGGANMFPKLYVEMYKSTVERNFERMASIHNTILEISSSVYSVRPSPSGYLAGLKCVLSIMGICNDEMVYPYERFDEKERTMLCRNLEKLKKNKNIVDKYL